MKYFIVLVAFLLNACQNTGQSNKDLSPELQKALENFEIMDGFEIELIAAEPLISDPVAMEIDEFGNWYVLEMPGYPLDLSKNGRVKKLVDTDNDGFPDKSIIFADSLTLPMGLMKWGKGILVADAPDILYLEDQDNDGKADLRETMLTGFSLSNPQHNMNTPKFGVDNWIYVGHSGAINSFAYEHVFSDKGDEIHFPNIATSPKLARNANGRNVRFKPITHELEILSGETQYGHTTDPWGHRFYTDNANHLFHEVIDARYLNANPNLIIEDAMEKIPDHGNACEIFPITLNPNHQLLTDVGVITSSCGVTWYDGGAFGEDFENITLIGEPVHNLIHIDKIEEEGATFTAKRVLEKKEFLASKDPWFRPVFFYVGPDAALYVIDYYRQIIEHPEWMSEEVNESGALYEGSSKGRIYRITPKKGLTMDWLNKLSLGELNSKTLISYLEHENGWYRRTAQRLLFQRNDTSVSPELQELIKNSNSKAAIPSLWLLFDWNKITPKDLQNAMTSQSPGVRENALQIADRLWSKELFRENKGLEIAIKKLADDENPRVRYQWLCSSTFFDFQDINQLKSSILARDINDKWVGIAAIASSHGSELELLKNAKEFLDNIPSENKKQFFKHLSATLSKKGEPGLIKQILAFSDDYDWCQTAMFDGLGQVLGHGGQIRPNKEEANQMINLFLKSENSDLRKSIIAVLRHEKTIPNKDEIYVKFISTDDILFQGDAMALLSLFAYPKIEQKIISLIIQASSDEQQLLALKALPRKISSNNLSRINAIYSSMPLSVKKQWIVYLRYNRNYVSELIRQVEIGNISTSDLTWPQIVGLMNYYDTDIRNYARSVFAINEDRKAVLQNYLPAAEMSGVASQGKIIFEQNCAICHQINGANGIEFGPDLATLRSRNKHSIITEIINPNNSIADKYGSWIFTLENEEKITGIILNENASNISLKLLGGNTQLIDKTKIVKREINKNSLMPNGLENNINLQQMADLITFINPN